MKRVLKRTPRPSVQRKRPQPSSETGHLWNQAVEGSLSGIVFTDPEGRISYANRAWIRMFGYEQPSEVLGRPASEFAEFSQNATEILATILAQGGWSGEASGRKKNGECFTIEISGAILRDAAGEPIGLMGSFIDVSRRNRAEAAQQSSEEQYRSLVESAVDPIFTCDPTGRYLYVNKAAATTLGWEPLELMGKSVDDVFPPDAAAKFRAGVQRVVESGESVTSEERIDIEGQPCWFSNILQPICGRDGSVEAVQGIVRDITALKRTENALRQSQERLQQAVHIADIGIFDHDHLAGTVYRSPEARQILGGQEAEPVVSDQMVRAENGQPPAFLKSIHPDDREKMHAALKHTHHAAHGLMDTEVRFLNPARGPRWVAWRAQTFFAGEGDACRPIRTIGAIRDITEQKRAAEELEQLHVQLWQAQKMESVGQLAGGVAHDFNNMLTVINGNVALALEQFDPADPVYAILEEIREAGHQSASLTRQLLGFARRQTRMPRVLDLNEAAGASINMLGRLIGENIQLVWRPAHDLWSVRVDPTQIEQILANLATNARDAIDDSGEISIRTANVVLGDTDCADRTGILPGEFVMLEVGDNGCGMDVETQGRIFEPFYTTKGVGRGTGLGLATVDGIVRQNNGFIEVESVTGQGTRFRVFLPRFVDHGALDKAVAPLAAPVATSATILLVEDQLMVLRLTMRMLQKLGYTVLSAGTPEEAVRLAGEHANDIQLLLTDVVMPQMNGHDLAKELVASHPRLKYLLFSGYPLGTAPHQSTLGDGVHFLPKPFSQDQLGAKVREVLDGP